MMSNLLENLKSELSLLYDNYVETNISIQQVHKLISDIIMKHIETNWNKSKKAHLSERHACYFSMEFLIGRSIYNNLLNLGIYQEVEAILKDFDIDITELEEIEDSALGNGGLGRLAACFLESAATLDLPLDGYGIRYKYGLFKQKIINGFQVEESDNWTKYGDPWSKRCDEDSVMVKFKNQTVLAVPYDVPIIGYNTKHIGTLRLWQSEAISDFDFNLFNEQKYLESSSEKVFAEDISRTLYPNDDAIDGKKLRLKQQYFFCSASISSILKKHRAKYGTLGNISEYISIQLNDTHPVISIPELIRQLTKNEGFEWDDALNAANKIFNYTNHTIMPEALEKWSFDLISELLPEISQIIFRLNELLINKMNKISIDKDDLEKILIINKDTVHMANLAMFVSSHVNGVAEIHTEILKKSTLHSWFKIVPNNFQNKTNGITQRRWLALCNNELTEFIESLLGNKNFLTDLEQLKKLSSYVQDDDIIRKFLSIKKTKKNQLADYILRKEEISINPDTIFDVQIKRLHEYKRQLMNAFSILYLYYEIKEGRLKDFTPTTFIFGAKSAPGYKRAKAIIKFINEIAKLIDDDIVVNKLIKVVFVSNYNVSYAEKIVAATEISEQISTAGTEASGTGNMKLMLNGAVTLGTLDGANIEIVEEAGIENNYIFGAKVEELEVIMDKYNSRKLMSSNPKINRVISSLIDGTVSDGGNGDFKELYLSLLDGASWHEPDNYYVLGDLEDYVHTKIKANKDYKETLEFGRKMWLNMCNAGKFSSDRTISNYANDIWKIKSIKL